MYELYPTFDDSRSRRRESTCVAKATDIVYINRKIPVIYSLLLFNLILISLIFIYIYIFII